MIEQQRGQSIFVANFNRMDSKEILIVLMFLAAGIPFLVVLSWHLRKKSDALQKSNQALKEKEKELRQLLLELHHRTKNNLQDISAMVYLQMKEQEEGTSRDSLQSVAGRIAAYGILHRMMYQKKNRFTSVNLAKYTRELVEYLEKNHSCPKPAYHFDLEDFYLEMDEALHIGLGMYELMENSFRHAFSHSENPELWITLTAARTAVEVHIRDNGPGILSDNGPARKGAFGLKLLRLLVEGREGTLLIEGRAAVFRIPVQRTD